MIKPKRSCFHSHLFYWLVILHTETLLSFLGPKAHKYLNCSFSCENQVFYLKMCTLNLQVFKKVFPFATLHLNFPFSKMGSYTYLSFKWLWVLHIKSITSPSPTQKTRVFPPAFADFKSRCISAKHYFKSCIQDGVDFLHVCVIGWSYILKVNAIKFSRYTIPWWTSVHFKIFWKHHSISAS